MSTVQLLTVNSSLGGPVKNSGLIGQLLLEQNAFQQALANNTLCLHQLSPQTSGSNDKRIQMLNQDISQFSKECNNKQQHFMIISGDHSTAMGTWAGVLDSLQAPNQFGLLWLDAHLDAHTYDSSPSANCHGMPVAALLGKSDARLRLLYPSLQHVAANRMFLLGARSYEPAELKLLNNTSVEIIFANQIDNFKQTFLSAYQTLNQTCSHIGVSVDLDIVDPDDAPGVATPVAGGIKSTELLAALASIQGHNKWCGLECTEFIPTADNDERTLRLLMDIIQLYSECS